MSAPFQIHSRADIPRTIAAMTQAGAGHEVPLYSALYQGRIALLPVFGSTPPRTVKEWQAKAAGPAVAVIGDDAHLTEDGPANWPIAPRLIRWARFIVVNGAMGRAEDYQRIVDLAQVHRRVLLIECSGDRIPEWVAVSEMYGRGALGQVIAPAPGFQHPAPVKREGMN